MTEYTAAERKAITKYLMKAGKEKIGKAPTRMVDMWARYFVNELESIGEPDKAQEMYDYYEEIWG